MPRKLSGDTRQIAFQLHVDLIDKLDIVAESMRQNRSSIIREMIAEQLFQTEKENPQIFKPYTFKSISD